MIDEVVIEHGIQVECSLVEENIHSTLQETSPSAILSPEILHTVLGLNPDFHESRLLTSHKMLHMGLT
jgi:hypothetical protein